MFRHRFQDICLLRFLRRPPGKGGGGRADQRDRTQRVEERISDEVHTTATSYILNCLRSTYLKASSPISTNSRCLLERLNGSIALTEVKFTPHKESFNLAYNSYFVDCLSGYGNFTKVKEMLADTYRNLAKHFCFPRSRLLTSLTRPSPSSLLLMSCTSHPILSRRTTTARTSTSQWPSA